MSEARMQDAMRSCQSRRGWDLRPYNETPFERFGRVIFKSWFPLFLFGLSLFLLMSYGS